MNLVLLLSVSVVLIFILGITVFSKKILVVRIGVEAFCFEIYRKTWFYEQLLERHHVRDYYQYQTIKKRLIEKHKINE